MKYRRKESVNTLILSILLITASFWVSGCKIEADFSTNRTVTTTYTDERSDCDSLGFFEVALTNAANVLVIGSSSEKEMNEACAIVGDEAKLFGKPLAKIQNMKAQVSGVSLIAMGFVEGELNDMKTTLHAACDSTLPLLGRKRAAEMLKNTAANFDHSEVYAAVTANCAKEIGAPLTAPANANQSQSDRREVARSSGQADGGTLSGKRGNAAGAQ